MKKQTVRLALVGSLALLSMGIQSCRKGCYQCSHNNDTVYRCSDDYGTHKEFVSKLEEYENVGYKCTKQ